MVTKTINVYENELEDLHVFRRKYKYSSMADLMVDMVLVFNKDKRGKK